MAERSESSVLSALASYRQHISGVNHSLFSTLIPAVEAIDTQNSELSPEAKQRLRIDYVRRLVGAGAALKTDPPLEKPSDLLKHWDVLAPQLALDGAGVATDEEWRAEQRDMYKTTILEGLEQVECPTGTWAFPEDFEVLMQHADGLEGPGWFQLRDRTERLIFWEGFSEWEDADQVESRVMNQEDLLEEADGLDEELDIAGGWMCGQGGESSALVVNCRRTGDEGEQGWSWRYVACLGADGYKIFDDAIALLDWYKTFGQPTKSDAAVSEDVVFDRM